MDIYKSLESISVNSHHMKRYISIVDFFCVNIVEGNGEIHHILPKCLFPHHAKDQNNLVKLPYRAHFLVHWALAKATNNYSLISAFNAMCNKNKDKLPNSILYSLGKESFRKAQMGENNCSYQIVSAWDKINNVRVRIPKQEFDSNRSTYGGITCKEAIEWKIANEGYVRKVSSEHQKKKASLATKGTVHAVCIATGTNLGRISKDDPRWKDGTVASYKHIISKKGKPNNSPTKFSKGTDSAQ